MAYSRGLGQRIDVLMIGDRETTSNACRAVDAQPNCQNKLPQLNRKLFTVSAESALRASC